uniref:Thyroglobulin type-1 domain-containing protein n=1 Tax=Mola mola TaxID=94237 RepID=A0A3Q3WHA4_MOLML
RYTLTLLLLLGLLLGLDWFLPPSGPSACEEERRAAMEASGVYVPSCEDGGAFTPTQCQQGGQCWCVDPTGRELPGTRRHGDSPVCSEGNMGSQCHHDGSFLPLQCDVTSCWCVSEDGQEVVGTRVPRQTASSNCSTSSFRV